MGGVGLHESHSCRHAAREQEQSRYSASVARATGLDLTLRAGTQCDGIPCWNLHLRCPARQMGLKCLRQPSGTVIRTVELLCEYGLMVTVAALLRGV